MSGYDYPGILVIGCDHPRGSVLSNAHDAEMLLVGNTKIGFQPNYNIANVDSEQEIYSVTELENSCFLQVP